jgi:hypothetical protein
MIDGRADAAATSTPCASARQGFGTDAEDKEPTDAGNDFLRGASQHDSLS